MDLHEVHHQPLEVLCLQALRALKDPQYDPQSEDFELVAPLLKNIEFVRKNIKSSGNLQDFIYEARSHLQYEVHPYGSVLLRENEHAEKLYIVLSGEVQKLCQRANHEVEQDVREKRLAEIKLGETYFVEEETKTAKLRRNNTKSLTNNLRRVTSMKKLTSDGTRPNIKIFEAPPSIDINMDSTINQKVTFSQSSSRKGSDDIKYSQEDSIMCQNPKSALLNIFTGPNKLTKFPSAQHLTPGQLTARSTKSYGLSIFPSLNDLQNIIEPMSSRSSRTRTRTKSIENEEALSYREKIIETHVEFIKAIAARNPDIETRCFTKGVVRLANARNFIPGDYFGETFLQRQVKENSIIAVSSEEVHLLTITKESYEMILAKIERLAEEKFEILSKFFSIMDDQDIKRFSQYFSQKHFKKDTTIYHQGDPARGLYFLSSGDVRLAREVETSSRNVTASNQPRFSRKVRVLRSNIVPEQFFGEELLSRQSFRQCTAFVNSQDAIVYFLDSQSCGKAKMNFPEFFELILGPNEERSSVVSNQTEGYFDSKVDSMTNLPLKLCCVTSNQSDRKNVMSISPRTQNYIKSSNEILTPKKAGANFEFEAKQKMEEVMQSNLNIIRRQNKALSDKNTAVGKHMEIYRNKFSRKVNIPIKLVNKDSQFPSSEEERFKNPSLFSPRYETNEFNIRRQLEHGEEKKVRLPKIPSSPNLHIRKDSELSNPVSVMISKLGNSPGLIASKNFELTRSPFVISSHANVIECASQNHLDKRKYN